MKKINGDVKVIHFRKFVSKKILKDVITRCPNLAIISMSRYASKKCGKGVWKLLRDAGLEVVVLRNRGRPSILEKSLERIKFVESKLK